MHDFEVHPLGTHLELQQLRQLVKLIEQHGQQWGWGIYPREVAQLAQHCVNTYHTCTHIQQPLS